jgi:hypothetical protein
MSQVIYVGPPESNTVLPAFVIQFLKLKDSAVISLVSTELPKEHAIEASKSCRLTLDWACAMPSTLHVSSNDKEWTAYLMASDIRVTMHMPHLFFNQLPIVLPYRWHKDLVREFAAWRDDHLTLPKLVNTESKYFFASTFLRIENHTCTFMQRNCLVENYQL